MLFLMDEPIKLVIPNEKATSWNTLNARVHWTKRHDIAQSAIWSVRAALPRKTNIYNCRVDIAVTAYIKGRGGPQDPCNVPAKLYIDGLIGRLIHDDSAKYVRRVTTEVVRRAESDRVVIIITPLGEKIEQH